MSVTLREFSCDPDVYSTPARSAMTITFKARPSVDRRNRVLILHCCPPLFLSRSSFSHVSYKAESGLCDPHHGRRNRWNGGSCESFHVWRRRCSPRRVLTLSLAPLANMSAFGYDQSANAAFQVRVTARGARVPFWTGRPPC